MCVRCYLITSKKNDFLHTLCLLNISGGNAEACEEVYVPVANCDSVWSGEITFWLAHHVFVGVKWGISAWSFGWRENLVCCCLRQGLSPGAKTLSVSLLLLWVSGVTGGCGHWWAAPVKRAGASPIGPWGFPASQALSFLICTWELFVSPKVLIVLQRALGTD